MELRRPRVDDRCSLESQLVARGGPSGITRQENVWKRANLKAKNDDSLRARRLAKIRKVIENLRADKAFSWCDELDLNLLSKVDHQWMSANTQLEVATPGQK